MKSGAKFLAILLLLLFVCSLPLWAMPFQPAVRNRIQKGEMGPYRIQTEQELHDRGIDTPTRIPLVDRLGRHSLDETINIIAILVDFSDHPSTVDPVFFDSLLFGTAVGTLNHYYNEVSYGSLNYTTYNLPSTLGWLRAPHPYSYYVDGQAGFGSYPNNAQKLAEDAVALADSFVNFSLYDQDGNGQVDALFIIHSGPGREVTGSMNDIHSHKWQMQHPQHVDSVTASVYSMEPEYWRNGGDMTVGVYAHEMGHAVFGFPDLYDTDYQSQGLGAWSLMAAGSWNGNLGDSPSHPDALCMCIAGFVNPTVISQNSTQVRIPSVDRVPSMYRLWTNGEANHELFLVENRQQIGYDAALPGSGLLIYHVDTLLNNNDSQWYPGHTNSGHYLTALEQADGNWDLEHNENTGDPSDPYPGGNNNHTFSNGSTPDSKSYCFNNTYVAVRNISASADTMFADLFVRQGAGNTIGLYLPDTTAAIGDTLTIPITMDDATGQNVTSFEIALTLDSSATETAEPYFDRSNSVIPAGWTLTQTHTLGTVTISGSGVTALSVPGCLVSLVLRSLPTDTAGTVALLTFTSATFNQGAVPVETTNGSLTMQAAQLRLQPGSITFGNLTTGSQSSMPVLLRNVGSVAIILDSVVVPAPFTTNFTVSDTLSPGTWWSLRTYFRPTVAQAYNDTVLIYSSASSQPTRLPVSARGVTGNLDVTPGVLDFDTVSVDTTADLTVSVNNAENAAHFIDLITFSSGANFRIIPAPQFPDTVAGHRSCAYTVRFTPSLGLALDTLTVNLNGADPVLIPVRGVGGPSGITDDGNGAVPSSFTLRQNYPNPFNPSTTLSFDVPANAFVTITVYDLLGRAVDVPLKGVVSQGTHTITWACPDCSSGVYLFVLASGNTRLVEKAILMK
jgi:immune inhibitor A